MKKLFLGLALSTTLLSASGCGTNSIDPMRVGLVGGKKSIYDKSFIEGAWNGMNDFQTGNSEAHIYSVNAGEDTTEEFNIGIRNLVDDNFGTIILPGYTYETAAFQSQSKYPDVNFILIDAIPFNGDYDDPKYETDDNMTSVLFAEEEGGFLAGVSAALTTKTNKVAFLGGMEVPPVERFGWGYAAGIAYVNKTEGKNVSLYGFEYNGDFGDVQGGTTTATTWYSAGVDVIFPAAGGTGTGVFSAAKGLVENGTDDIHVIGVDMNQWDLGKYGSNNQSVTLTTAVKKVDVVINDVLNKMEQDQFPGGQNKTYNFSDGAVGILKDSNNSNLSAANITKINAIEAKISDGTISIPKNCSGLNSFLDSNSATAIKTKVNCS